jgi:hypothetical protein
VQVGSVLFRDPSAPTRITRDLSDELAARGLGSVTDAVGLAHRPNDQAQHQDDQQQDDQQQDDQQTRHETRSPR